MLLTFVDVEGVNILRVELSNGYAVLADPYLFTELNGQEGRLITLDEIKDTNSPNLFHKANNLGYNLFYKDIGSYYGVTEKLGIRNQQTYDSSSTYDLLNNYKRLDCILFVPYENSSGRIRIFDDTTGILLKSKTVASGDSAVHLSVDVEGVNILRISLSNNRIIVADPYLFTELKVRRQ